MDIFQGSSPPNFISFCLENQNIDESQTPTNTTVNIPTQSEQTFDPSSVLTANLVQDPIPTSLPHVRFVTFQDQNTTESPHSIDSNVDVTAYATEMVQRMEARQVAASPSAEEIDESRPEASSGTEGLSTPPLLDPRKTSTPTQAGRNLGELPSLSQLESLLQIAVTTSTEFPELQVTASTSRVVPGTSFSQIEEDSSSTTSGPPPLPKGKARVTEEISDVDTAGAASGLDDFPPLERILDLTTFPHCTERFQAVQSLSPEKAPILSLRITLTTHLGRQRWVPDNRRNH